MPERYIILLNNDAHIKIFKHQAIEHYIFGGSINNKSGAFVQTIGNKNSTITRVPENYLS